MSLDDIDQASPAEPGPLDLAEASALLCWELPALGLLTQENHEILAAWVELRLRFNRSERVRCWLVRVWVSPPNGDKASALAELWHWPESSEWELATLTLDQP